MTTTIKTLVPDLPTADDLLPYLRRIDEAHWYTNFGPLTQEFEAALKDYFFAGSGADLVTTSTGTSALELAIQALRLPAGRRVLVPSYTFPATVTAILKNGLEPVFADVDADTWMLTPETAREAVERADVALILPVATFGNPLPGADWERFIFDTGIPVVVDAAAALGSQAIAPNVIWCFSMHATKAFASGEGGLVVSTNRKYIESVRSLTNFGFFGGEIVMLGTNAKLSEYHAAVGLAQLKRFAGLKEKRLQVFGWYRAHLQASCGNKVSFQKQNPGCIPAVLPLRLPTAADLPVVEKALNDAGILTRRWYAPAAHQHRDLGGAYYRNIFSDLKNTYELVSRCIGVPFHTFLSEADVRQIVACMASAMASR
jgi:dTDP-4-amino-4,6-dideoxygalactose transaminase